jgi:TolB-like protein
MPRDPARFLAELKRRGVLRAAGMYVVGAWLVIQVADTTFPHLQLPAWTVSAVIVLAIAGFPVVMALAWAFDLTPARFQATTQAQPEGDGPAAPKPLSVRGRLAFSGAVVVMAALAGWLWLRAYTPAPARDDAVLILPFQVSGAAELAYLTDGLVDLVGRNLEGVAGLRIADPHTSVRIAQAEAGTGAIDAERARRLAALAGARHFILGSLTEHGGRLALSARLYDGEAAGELPEIVSVNGDAAALFELVDRLTAELVVSRFGPASAQLTRRAARTTQSAEALKQFLRAEQSLRLAQYDSAVAGFQRALAEDSAFALAHYRLAVAAVQNHSARVAADAIERALELSSRLGARDRRLLEAFAHVHAGRANQAEAAYRAILEQYPDDLEASVQLGGVLALYNPLRGRPAAEAFPYLARVSKLDPAYVCPICTMVNLVLSQGDIGAADSLMSVRYPGSPIYTYRAGAAAARGDSVAVGQWLSRTTQPAFWQASWVAAFFGDYDNAVRLLTEARPLAELSDPVRVLAHLTLADIQAARLRWQAMQDELREVARLAPRRAMLRRAYCTLLPFIERPATELQAVRDELAAWRPEQHDAAGERLVLRDFLPYVRSYLLALAHARLNNLQAAQAEAVRLDSIARHGPASTLGHDLALTIRAEIALRRDQPDRALAHLDSIRAEVPMEILNAVAAGYFRSELADVLTLDDARFLRIRTLLRLGRAADAQRWAENGFFRVGGNPLYAPALDLVRAEAYDMAGASERAAQLYASYLQKTALADADMRSGPNQARARLSQLTGDIEMK